MTHEVKDELEDIKQVCVLRAPIAKVWAAVSTSDGLAAWFMPNNFQPQIGYEFELNAGPYGKSPCKVTVLEPPTRLAFRWGKDWTLTFELKDLDGQTEFTLIHSGWSRDQLTEFGEAHGIVRERMNNGWAGIGKKLGAYVEE